MRIGKYRFLNNLKSFLPQPLSTATHFVSQAQDHDNISQIKESGEASFIRLSLEEMSVNTRTVLPPKPTLAVSHLVNHEVSNLTSYQEEVSYIAYTQVSENADVNMADVAKDRVCSALNQSCSYGSVGHRTLYSKDGGIALISEHEGNLSRMDKLELQLAKLNARVKVLELGQSTLKKASIGYLEIRHRFLDTYRRDRWNEDTINRTRINIDNATAHDPDPVTDAYLYESGTRKDTLLYTEIYGYPYGEVLQLGVLCTIVSEFIN